MYKEYSKVVFEKDERCSELEKKLVAVTAERDEVKIRLKRYDTGENAKENVHLNDLASLEIEGMR